MNRTIETADDFTIKTIVSVDELTNYDLIYIYHHLHLGAIVQLEAAGINLKGELRYRVFFKGFMLGYIIIGEMVQSIYENTKSLEGQIVNIEKQKFLPVKGIDICLQATKMRMVS